MWIIDAAKSAIENVKETVGSMSLFGGLKEKASNVLNKVKSRAGKAWDAVKEGGSPWEKVKGVFKSFFSDVEKVETEEEKKKSETAKETGAVLKNMDSTAATGALLPALTAKDKDGKDIEVPAVVNEVVGLAYDTAKTLDTDRKNAKQAKDGETMGVLAHIADKIDPKKNPEKKPLSDDEKKLAFSYGSKFAIALKAKYPDKNDFKKALDDFSKATENAPVGFHTFQTDTFKGLFKGGSMLDVFAPVIDKLGMIQKGKIFAGLASGGFVSDLKSGKVPETLLEATETILPNTNEVQRTDLLKTVGQILAQKNLGVNFPTNEQLTNIVFAVDNKDLEELSNLFA